MSWEVRLTSCPGHGRNKSIITIQSNYTPLPVTYCGIASAVVGAYSSGSTSFRLLDDEQSIPAVSLVTSSVTAMNAIVCDGPTVLHRTRHFQVSPLRYVPWSFAFQEGGALLRRGATQILV